MKLASTEIVAELVAHAHQDLDRALELWPFVAEQKLLAAHAAGRLPTAEGCDREVCEGRPHGDWPYHHPAKLDRLPSPEGHADPVGEQVSAGREQPEAADRRAQLVYLDALARLAKHAAGVEDALRRIRRARVALGGQLPAVDAALVAHAKAKKVGVGPDGRPGTSGVSLDEADRQRKGAVEAEAACLCCQLGISVVGRLRAGLCNTDYQAWYRAGMPDRGEWIAARKRYLDSKNESELAERGESAEIVQLDAYRTRLEEAA